MCTLYFMGTSNFCGFIHVKELAIYIIRDNLALPEGLTKYLNRIFLSLSEADPTH